MTPTIGRIVHYTFPQNEPAPNHGDTVPAIITAVFSDDCVNLRIFADQEPAKPSVQEWRTSVIRKGADNWPYGQDCWEWPPRV